MADDNSNSDDSSWIEEETDNGSASSSSPGASFEEESYEEETYDGTGSSLASPPKPSFSSSSPETKMSLETPVGSSEYSASLKGGDSRDSDTDSDESDHSESLVVDMDDEESTDASSSQADETTTSMGDDSESSLPQSNSKWRESYKELSTSRHNNNENGSKLNGSQKEGLVGGTADFGGSSHHKSTDFGGSSHDKSSEVLLMSARSLNHSSHHSGDSSSASLLQTSAQNPLESSISKMDSSDIADLQDMLVASDDEELERSFEKLISPGHVKSKKNHFESLKDKPPPEKPPLDVSDIRQADTDDDDDDDEGYGILKEDDKEEPPVDKETQLLMLQRKAEKARGDPSNYHSSDDDDSAVLLDDLAQKESNTSMESKENSTESDDQSIDGSETSPAVLAKQASAKWEKSVASEGEVDLSNSKSSVHRQKDILLASDRQLDQDESEQSFEGDDEELGASKRPDELRQDLEAQVKERIQTNDEDVKKELERSIHRDANRKT
ncbi:MAG: hypothetical protein SGARI_001714, partial [Bacillariaceae sp.]